MAYSAKKLRVQLPCGQVTQCEGDTIPGPGAFPDQLLRDCYPRTPYKPCADSEALGDPRLPWYPGAILVDPDDLPALRQELEAQLKEIDEAEQRLKEQG